MKTINILAIDHPLLDVEAQVSLNFMKKFNVEPNGATLLGDDQKGLYEELHSNEYEPSYVPGGAAQNTIRMLQWIINNPRKLQCHYLGCVGRDNRADHLREYMAQTGVKFRYEVVDKSSTGFCIVLIDGTNRSLVTYLGASSKFSTKFLCEKESWSMIENSQIYYLVGYFVGSSMDSVNILLNHLEKTNKTLCLNLASPYIASQQWRRIDHIIQYTDFVFGTADEARAFAEAKQLEDRTPAGTANYFASLPSVLGGDRRRLIVFTDGPGLIMVLSSEDMQIRMFEVDPVPMEEIIDTNGAGDGFAAGFLASYLLESDLKKAIKSGKKAACYIIRRSGFSLHSREEY